MFVSSASFSAVQCKEVVGSGSWDEDRVRINEYPSLLKKEGLASGNVLVNFSFQV
jgi:hypothetical protein